MEKEEYKRQCCVCGKITYNADTYGTWIKKTQNRYRRNKDLLKPQYLDKWVEYRCIDKIYK